jgi:hypothetical protein
VGLEPLSVRKAGAPASLARDARWAGVSLLLITKTLDVVTTVIGLSLFPALAERNPVAELLIAQFGLVPGLVLGGVLTVVGMAIFVETGSSVLTKLEPGRQWPLVLARTVGYVPLSLFFAVLAVNNAFLIGRAASM